MSGIARKHRKALEGGAPRPYVLAVDDNLDTLTILSTFLEHEGCEVATARGGEEALDLYAARLPDAVLLDVMMPGLSGLEVCRQMKRMSAPVFVPIILLTALYESKHKIEGLGAGADDYVTKPFDPYEVHARVRAMIRIKNLQEDLTRTRASLDEASGRIEDWARERLGINSFALEAPRRKEVTVLFCDIRDFTPMADQLDPDELQLVLDEYLEEMGDAATANGGSVNKVLGDGLMVLFNDPRDQEDHQMRGIKAGLEMAERVRALDARLHGRLPDRLSVGVGVHTGTATVGRLGRKRMLDYTAVGSSINLASRLQGLATDNSVIATSATYASLGEKITTRNERRTTLKGFAHPVTIAEILSVR
jgi:adenylate cyclase